MTVQQTLEAAGHLVTKAGDSYGLGRTLCCNITAKEYRRILPRWFRRDVFGAKYENGTLRMSPFAAAVVLLPKLQEEPDGD